MEKNKKCPACKGRLQERITDYYCRVCDNTFSEEELEYVEKNSNFNPDVDVSDEELEISFGIK